MMHVKQPEERYSFNDLKKIHIGEMSRKRKFMRLENSPPLITLLMVVKSSKILPSTCQNLQNLTVNRQRNPHFRGYPYCPVNGQYSPHLALCVQFSFVGVEVKWKKVSLVLSKILLQV